MQTYKERKRRCMKDLEERKGEFEYEDSDLEEDFEYVDDDLDAIAAMLKVKEITKRVVRNEELIELILEKMKKGRVKKDILERIEAFLNK